ncbi:hypothetical protein SY26_06700 [Paracoccus sp. 228]|nr:hypothetical protein SY26_06700 [Paracoccus sp. 228]
MQASGLIGRPCRQRLLPKRLTLFLAFNILSDGLPHQVMRGTVLCFGKFPHPGMNLGIQLYGNRVNGSHEVLRVRMVLLHYTIDTWRRQRGILSPFADVASLA